MEGVKSKILMLKINDKINYVLFSMIPDSPIEDHKDFEEKILINNLNGKFINGFRVENGKIISRLVYNTINKCESDYWEGYDLGCDQTLDEVIITTSSSTEDQYTIQIDYIYNFSGGGSDSYYYDFQGYNSGASWGGSTTTTPIPDEEEAIILRVIIDDSIYEHPCLAKVLKNILNSNSALYLKTIANFINNPKYDLIFTVGECVRTNDACTNGDNVDTTGEVFIKI